MKKRLFIGIKVRPSKKLLDFYSDLKQQLKDEKISWVSLENMHLTLKFLGDTATDLIPEINKCLKKISESTEKFSIEINGLGSFKRNRKTSVIWVGLENTNELNLLAQKVVKEMEVLGFEKETRPFKAHLTLGRVKYISNEKLMNNLVEEHKNVFFQEMLVEDFILFESILKPSGVVYKIVEQFKIP